MNKINPAIHHGPATPVEFTDARLNPLTISWTHRIAAIVAADIVAGYVATLPITHLDQIDPALLPFTPLGLGLFPGYTLSFFIAGLLPSLLMAQVQLGRGLPRVGAAILWGVLIAAFVFAVGFIYAALRSGVPVALGLLGFLWPALIVGALAGLAGWAYLKLARAYLM